MITLIHKTTFQVTLNGSKPELDEAHVFMLANAYTVVSAETKSADHESNNDYFTLVGEKVEVKGEQ